MQPQRLVVPLFQRPYVWNKENQWQPLWEDIARVAIRALNQPGTNIPPHFLGAVVLQQTTVAVGLMQERTIIDGQQRLTTLQLFLDALHAVLLTNRAMTPAMRIEPLIENAEAFRQRAEDRFKVWPTNRDRPPFNAVMAARHPIDYAAVGFSGERMVQAHRYFSEQIQEWLLAGGPSESSARAEVLERTARELLQLVVIDLTSDENAQEIFETLNARGAQLTSADLIKNFVFQRLLESGADVERIYDESWKEFETAFWEAEVNFGRMRYPRASAFLNHWLAAKTGEVVVASEVFNRFKSYVDHDSNRVMTEIVVDIRTAADAYRSFIEASLPTAPQASRIGLFAYRTTALESEIVKPLVLHLFDPSEEPIGEDQINLVLDSVESWMVRRALVRAGTASYSQAIAEMISAIRNGERELAGDIIRDYLADQQAGSRYWPDDDEIEAELETQLSYRRLSRGRLRMILEAIEDHLRGFRNGQDGLSAERVQRGKLHIEHVMPRKWQAHWPLGSNPDAEIERDRIVHNIGNLTLLPGKLNAKVSNGPWAGPAGKKEALEAHDVFFLNRELKKFAGGQWDEARIAQRRVSLVRSIREIWPVPDDYVSTFTPDKPKRSLVGVEIADLISAGWIEAGSTLRPKPAKHAGRVATVLSDGRVDVDGTIFSSPSMAAVHIAGRSANGWRFFYVDPASKTTLRDLRAAYLESVASDSDIGDDDGDDDDE